MFFKEIEKWLNIDKILNTILSLILSLPSLLRTILVLFILYFIMLGLVTFLKKAMVEVPIKLMTIFLFGVIAYLVFLKFF